YSAERDVRHLPLPVPDSHPEQGRQPGNHPARRPANAAQPAALVRGGGVRPEGGHPPVSGRRVLVTGARGMLGTDLCEILYAEGDTPLPTDNRAGENTYPLDITDIAGARAL